MKDLQPLAFGSAKPQPELDGSAGPSGKGPVVWLLARLFCLLMLLTQGLAVAFFITAIIDPVWTDKSLRGHPEQIAAVRFFCVIFAGIFGLPLLPMVPMLVFPRSQFGWYLGAIALGLGIFTTCGWPIAIPLIVYWFHPDVKRYSGLSVGAIAPHAL
ncbi:MAG: hypothetical protein ACKVP0_19585 [Pirellulaceae bacterium]